MKALRLAALLLISSGVTGAAGLLAGCGGSSSAITPAAERLQREDLVATAHGLRRAEASTAREMAAARVAWPLVANGLPASITPATRASLSAAEPHRACDRRPTAAEQAASPLTDRAGGWHRRPVPDLQRPHRAWLDAHRCGREGDRRRLAGGRDASRGKTSRSTSTASTTGTSMAALIGKSLLAGYEKLGGARAFGVSLTQAEVDALAGAYSPATERLHPHPGVKLGS